MLLARLIAKQDFATTTAAVIQRAEVLVEDSPIGHLNLSQDFDSSPLLVQPRLQLDDGAGGQLAGVDVSYPAIITGWTVGGNDPGATTTDDTTVTSDLDSGGRTWKRSVVASTGSRRDSNMASGPLGYEVEVGGPPPGWAVPVDITLQLVGRGATAGTSSTLPLITSGYADKSRRKWDGDGHILEIDGAGPEHLYRDREIDVELAAGHGLTHGQIGELAMLAAEVPAALIEIDPALGAPRNIPVEEHCIPLWQFLENVFRPIGYVIMAGRSDGIFRAVPLEIGDETPVAVLTAGAASDLEAASAVTIESDSKLPTCVTVTGNRLVETAAGFGAGSGTLTEEVVIETFEDGFTLPIAIAQQASGAATITPTGLTASPQDNRLTHKTTIRITYEDSCEVLKYVKEEGYMAPKAARYIAAGTTTGEPRTYPLANVYFYDSIPAADDATEGFQWITHRWQVLSEQWEEPIFNAAGRRVGTTTRKSAWKNPQASIKSRATPAITWETTIYTAGRFLTAGFSGVLFDAERYFAGPIAPDESYPTGTSSTHPGLTVVLRHTEQVDETRTVDDQDYETAVVKATTTHALPSGVTQLYPGGTSSTDTEVGLTATTRDDRSVIGGKPVSVQSGTGFQGESLPTVVTTGVSGGTPGAEICDAEEIDRDRQETFDVTICVKLTQPGGSLLEVKSRTKNLSSDFIETEAEAERWALQELKVARGFPVQLSLASPMPVLDAGQVVNVSLPELGIEGDLKVWEHKTTIEGGAEGRVKDEIGLLLPPGIVV